MGMDGVPATLALARIDGNSLVDQFAVCVCDRVNKAILIGGTSSLECIQSILREQTPSTLVYVDTNKANASSDVEDIQNVIQQLSSSMDPEDRFQCLVEQVPSSKVGVTREDLIHRLKSIVKNASNLGSLNHFWLSNAHRDVVSAAMKSEDVEAHTEQGYTVQSLFPASTLYIEPTALKALHVFPDLTNGPRSADKYGSLLSLFSSYCITGCGRSLMQNIIGSPVGEESEIQRRLDIISVLLSSETIRSVLNIKVLRKIGNIENLRNKLKVAYGSRSTEKKGSPLDLKALMSLYSVIGVGVTLCQVVKEIMENFAETSTGTQTGNTGIPDTARRSLEDYLTGLSKCVGELLKYKDMIDYAVDVGEFRVSQEKVIRISAGVSGEYDATRTEKEKWEKAMDKYRESISKRVTGVGNADAIKISTFDNQMMLRSTRKMREDVIKHMKGRMTVNRINKNEFLFSTVEFDEMQEHYKTAAKRHSMVELDCVRDISDVACSYVQPLTKLVRNFAYLDCLFAFASHISKEPCKYTRPTFNDRGILNVVQARHVLMDGNPDREHIPNDVSLDISAKRFAFITGPNMGGKSTYMRTMALVCILGHIGMFVPAESAEIPMIDRVFCRVGAGDSLLDGISTFMAEMVEVSHLCKYATKKSLVLIDELGRGTSTKDGYGIAHSISKHFATTVGCLTFFATHFSELKEHAENEEIKEYIQPLFLNVENDQKNDLRFTYQLKSGFCSQSLGIQVAKMAMFPTEVLNDAQAILADMETND